MPEPLISPAEAPTGLAAVDALLQTFNQASAPGLVVGIAQGGQTIYRRGLGLASIEHAVANTPRTRMRIGSTSKQFTCLAVLLLAEQGLLSIDDPVQRHLPELPMLAAGATGGPTLRQLMSHTGGWRCHVALSMFAHGLAIQPKGATLSLLARQGELNFEPGTQMMYSNGGYHLLSKVVERASGQSFEAFLAERIFKPLGMGDTESVPSDFDIRAGMATLYMALPGGGWRRGIFPSHEIGGEGAMVSTLDDMLRWTAHLRGADKRLGRPESWALMLAPTTLSSGVVSDYGLGLMRHHYRGTEVIHHSGGVNGGASRMITLPAHGLDIVIMTNGALVSPAVLSLKIIDALLAGVLDAPEEHALVAAYPALPGTRYHDPETGLLVSFGDVAGKLGLGWLGAPPVPLRSSAQRLWLECHDIGVSPVSIDTAALAGDTAPASITLTEGGISRQLARLPAQAPEVAGVAEQWVGRYQSPDLGARAQVTFEQGRLLLKIQGTHGGHTLQALPLSAGAMSFVSTDPLLGAAGGGGLITLDRGANGVTGFRVDIPRMRKLRFLREDAVEAA